MIVITIFMIIVNVYDQICQRQQNTANLQQITKGDILIHHTNHLPSVQMSSGSKNQKRLDRLPFQACPQMVVYHTSTKMSNEISRVFHKKALDKRCILAYNRNRKSIPVDGLLPLVGKKITAFSWKLWGGYFFLFLR